MMNKIKMTSGKARKILYGFYNKDCYFNTPLYEAIPFILKENKDLQEENEKLKKQIAEYQDEIFARDNNWYDMQG